MHACVRDIMTTGVVTVRPDTPYQAVAAMLREHRVRGFPVTRDGEVVGVSRAALASANGSATPSPSASSVARSTVPEN